MSTTSNSRSREAAGLIELSLRRLAIAYPFHAAVLSRFVIMERWDIETAAVTATKDGRLALYYNPNFILTIRLDEVVGVMLHEVHHVLLGHLFTTREMYPDRWARTAAEEVTVNEFVRERLPGNPITLADFSDLPPMESTDERYHRLRRLAETDRLPVADPGPTIGSKRCTIDSHEIWLDQELQLTQVKSIVREALWQATDIVGIAAVPHDVRQHIKSSGVGSFPFERRVGPIGAGGKDWRVVLHRYLGQVAICQTSHSTPNRRCPELVGIVPGVARRPGKPSVMAVIDTSGSITSDDLAAVERELVAMTRRYCVTVVECDAKIHKVYRYKSLREVRGGGGTDLRPPLEARFLQQYRTDVIVYFTDGRGLAPKTAPRVPVIWCLVPGGIRPASWGRVVEISNPK